MEWVIYDVGGSRGQRGEVLVYLGLISLDVDSLTAVWAPFLDDVDVLIFLAPISVFDQSLAEDKRVNRLVSQGALYIASSTIYVFLYSSILSSYGARSAQTSCFARPTSSSCLINVISSIPNSKQGCSSLNL